MGFARPTESGQRVAQARSSPGTYRVKRAGRRSALIVVPVVERDYSRSVSTRFLKVSAEKSTYYWWGRAGQLRASSVPDMTTGHNRGPAPKTPVLERSTRETAILEGAV